MLSKKYLIYVLPLSFAFSVHAENASKNKIDEIVITATRTPVAIEKVGSSIDVITEQELESKQIRFISDDLNNLAGVTVDQSGPRGSLSSVRIRGQNPYSTYVLIDGMEVSDPSQPQTNFDFSQMTANAVSRVEVLKGSQSVLYGGDAIGGVINIQTSRGQGEAKGSLYSEAGSYDTYTVGGEFQGGLMDDRISYNIDLQYLESGGFSAADEDLAGNSEDDEYDNLSINSTLSYSINEALDVGLSIRGAEGTIHYDSFGGAFGDNPNLGDDYEQTAIRLFGNYDAMTGFITGQVAYTTVSNQREGFGSSFGDFDTEGERKKIDLQNNFNFNNEQVLTLGAELENESFVSSNVPLGEEVDVNGFYGLYLFSVMNNIHLSFGGRLDDHNTFGQFDTYRGTVAYLLNNGSTKLKSSVATGFRAPSLSELYGACCGETFGNTALEPEESESWDLGIEQHFADGSASVELVYFNISTDNKIDFCCFGNGNLPNYFNVPGKTKSNGVELTASFSLSDAIAMAVTYAYNDTTDSTGSRLPQRPLNTLSTNVYYLFSEAGSINFNLNHYQDMISSNGAELDEPWMATLALAYDFSESLAITVRIENLFDDQYQSQLGYGTADRSIYGGIKVRF